MNFSDDNGRLEDSITNENEESSCFSLIDYSESNQSIDDDSDLDLFDCYEVALMEQKASATLVSNGASNMGVSTIGSGEETESSISNENIYSPRQVSEAGWAKKLKIATGSETNTGFGKDIDRKDNISISDGPVAMLPCSLEPKETLVEMDVEGKTMCVSVNKWNTQGFPQHSVLNKRNINEGKSFTVDKKCSGIPGMTSGDEARVSHYLIIDEMSIVQEDDSKIQNKCLGINDTNSVESLDIDNVKLHTLGNVDKGEKHTSSLHMDNVDDNVNRFVCDSKGKEADMDYYGYIDTAGHGNEEVAFCQEDRAHMMNLDDKTLKSEENEMFFRKYEGSENGEKHIESTKTTVSKIEIISGSNLCAQQLEIKESIMFNATEAHIEKDSAFVEHLHSRKKVNCKTEGQTFYFDTQVLNCSEASDSSLSSSQELQPENPGNCEIYTQGRSTQNRYCVEKNKETVDGESSPKDIKPLMLTCIKDKSNDSKVLKQQDIGVYFGLKPQHGTGDKIKLQTNKPSGLTVNDVLRDRTLRYHKGSKKSNAKCIDSSDQELSSGNTDTLQSSTANRKCPFYKKIPGMKSFLNKY
mgnify:CR=1 FL=1